MNPPHLMKTPVTALTAAEKRRATYENRHVIIHKGPSLSSSTVEVEFQGKQEYKINDRTDGKEAVNKRGP